jgi:HTH-type transcriptional regulator/antitoxin HigA
MTIPVSEYLPDFPSRPGETLLETLEFKDMTQAELALRMGRPKKTINEIIKGKVAITPETALQLELALDIPASFWNKRELDYHEALARLEQKQKLEEWLEWLDKIPYKELLQRHWIPNNTQPIEILKSVLAFFGVVSPEQWEILWAEKLNVAFRKSTAYSINEVSVSAWLRKAELLASEIDCDTYNEANFRQALLILRNLTIEEPSPELYRERILEICRTAGVAFVVIPNLAQSRIFGSSQWLSPRKALIAVSLYHKTDDNFWYTFFHEAAHLLLHSKKELFINLDDAEGYINSEIEIEADQYTREFLIPQNSLLEFIRSRSLTKNGEPFISPESICDFAHQIGVSPSIVVGRLQHDRLLNYKFNNQLKTKLEWDDTDEIGIRIKATKCSVLGNG